MLEGYQKLELDSEWSIKVADLSAFLRKNIALVPGSDREMPFTGVTAEGCQTASADRNRQWVLVSRYMGIIPRGGAYGHRPELSGIGRGSGQQRELKE